MKRVLALGCLGVLAGLAVMLLPLIVVEPTPSTRLDNQGIFSRDSGAVITNGPFWINRPMEVFGLTSASFAVAFLTYVTSRRLMRRRTITSSTKAD